MGNKQKRRKAAEGVGKQMDPKTAIQIILNAFKNHTFSWDVVTAAGFLINWIGGKIAGGAVTANPTAGGTDAPELHLFMPLDDDTATHYLETLGDTDPEGNQHIVAIPWALLAQWLIGFLAKRLGKTA